MGIRSYLNVVRAGKCRSGEGRRIEESENQLLSSLTADRCG
jgi:hypothetical protein